MERDQLFDLMDLLGTRATQRLRRVLDIASLANKETRIAEIELEDIAALWGVQRIAVRTFIDRMIDIEKNGEPLITYDHVLRHGQNTIYRIHFAPWFPLDLS